MGSPEFVKQASTEQLLGPEDLGPDLFADPRHRRYPMHTKAATWLSAAFLYDKWPQLPVKEAAAAEARLLEMADVWHIRPLIEGLKEKVAASRRDSLSALPDEDFAWSRDGERHLPLRNALEVRAAAEYLVKWRDEFTFPDRQDMARRILQKAARHGAALGDYDDFLEKAAGFGGCSAAQAAGLVRGRAKLARSGHPDIANELEKMAETIMADTRRARMPNMLAKVAETIDMVDRLLHISEYSEAVPRAEDVLFALTRKAASALAEQHLRTTTGSVYDKDDLARLRTRTVRDYMGDALAEATTSDGLTVDAVKLAEIVPTLPLGDARIFDQLCKDVGIRTFAKEAADHRVGFTREDLRALAATHRSEAVLAFPSPRVWTPWRV
jgi:hypothetical protein